MSSSPEVRMICVDLDGTLVEGGSTRVAPDNVWALRRAAERGVKVVIATGRSYRYAAGIAGKLGVCEAVVVLNGAGVVAVDGRLIASSPLAGAEAGALYALAGDLRVVCRAYTWDAIFQHSGAPDGRDSSGVAARADVNMVPVASYDLMPRDEVFKVTFIDERADLEVSDIKAALPKELRRLSVATCFTRWLEFTQRGATKQAGAQRLAGMLGIERENVMAIGDHENDLDLIRWAGLGIYVDNAPPELKRYADVVAPPNVAGGVAWAIRRYVLGEERGQMPV